MKNNNGYYSIVQFSEFPERGEFLNIGIVLFSNNKPSVLTKMSNSFSRLERFFGVHLQSRLPVDLQVLENRLALEFANDWNENAFSKFQSLRTGKLRLSEPRLITVEEAELTAQNLFDELIANSPKRRRSTQPVKLLREQFRANHVEKMLERPAPIQLRGGLTLKAPFAYQNGSYNLIRGISLAGDPDTSFKQVSALAVEGALLSGETELAEKKKLVLVADTPNVDNEFVSVVEDMVIDHQVGFYRLNDMTPLIDDIRRNYQPQRHLV